MLLDLLYPEALKTQRVFEFCWSNSMVCIKTLNSCAEEWDWNRHCWKKLTLNDEIWFQHRLSFLRAILSQLATRSFCSERSQERQCSEQQWRSSSSKWSSLHIDDREWLFQSAVFACILAALAMAPRRVLLFFHRQLLVRVFSAAVFRSQLDREETHFLAGDIGWSHNDPTFKRSKTL